jgi:tetratricopeptide (TPR) repeat protein
MTTLLFWTAAAHAAPAQTTLDAAKNLYASAAYEEALAALDSVGDAAVRGDVDQYRAFCLVALDRTAEAEKAIAAVVTARPAYVPDPSEVSPRIRDVFLRTRRQLLPDIARRLYVVGKSALERKDRAAAMAAFKGVVDLAGSDAPGEGTLGELTLLATGFLELAAALPEPAPEAVPGIPPAAVPAPGIVTPPLVRRQVLPPWDPSVTGGRVREYAGAIRVTIAADGKVDTAEIVRPVHPAYDRLLIRAALTWLYEPARRNGVAMSSEKVVEVRLTPGKQP